MRKLVALANMTLDGYAASNEGMGLEWTFSGYSEEVARFHAEQVRADVDMALYGRRTYELMYGYWPSVYDGTSGEEPSDTERAHAQWVHGVDKVVFSTTLGSADWNNTRLIRHDVADEVRALKAGPGANMAIYGSPTLVHSLVEMGLVDEFRIVLYPVTVGSGTPLFPPTAALALELLESHVFQTGAIHLRYGRME